MTLDGHERPEAPAPPSQSGITATPIALPERRVAQQRLRGRDRLIGDISGAVREHVERPGHAFGVWVLSGLGGSGKTTAALEIAHRLAEEGPTAHIWWVSAEGGSGLSGPLYAVAFHAGADPGAFGLGHEADVLWRHLEELREPWLLVLDNVNTPTVLAPRDRTLQEGVGWLRSPRRLPGAVLITSRSSGWTGHADWVEEFAVDVLDGVDGAQVLLDQAPAAGEPEAARRLAEHLGGLPLALDLAGTFLGRPALATGWPPAEGPKTFDEYRHSLEERQRAVAAAQPQSPTGLERDLARITATWELSLDFLKEQENHAAEPLMLLLSAFGPTPVPHLRLLDPESILGSGLFTAGLPSSPRLRFSSTDLRTALEGLTGLRFVRVESVGGQAGDTGGRITIHPVVRLSMRTSRSFTLAARQLRDLVVTLLDKASGHLDPAAPPDWPRWQEIAPHCPAPLDLPLAGEPESVVVEATEPALRAGQYRYYIGLYHDARRELEAVTDVRRQHLGADHPDTLTARLALALALRDQGRLHEAEAEYHAVVRACDDTLPPGDPLAQSARSGRARVLRELGRYAEAERELRAVLRLREEAAPPDPRSVLRTRHDLATVWHKRGALREAAAELREVRAACRRMFGDGDELSLACGISLVRVLRDAGGIDEAAVICSAVVTELAKYRDTDHPDMLIFKHEMARIHRDQERLTAAESELRRFWTVNRRRFGDEHPDAVANRHELATVLHMLGRLEEAEGHFEAVLGANTRRFGDDHPNVRMCRHNLGLVRADLAQRAADGEPPGADDIPGERTMADTTPHDAGAGENGTGSGTAPAAPTLADALARVPPSSDPATRRVLDRFTRPRLSRGGAEPGGGGGYSTAWTGSSYPSHYNTRGVTYRAPAPERDEPKGLSLPGPLREHDAFRALATGTEGEEVVAALKADQYERRVTVLQHVLTGLDARYGAASPFGPVSRARHLLEEAGRQAPDVTAALLMDPAVGRWLSHVMSGLRERRDGSGLPQWAGPGHLYALAAAAAIRAGLTFTCRVPVHRGLAVLPTLGVADLGATAAQTAGVEGTAGETTVRTSGSTVRLPASPGRPAPGWRPLRPATTGGAVYLDDAHPFRGGEGPPERPDPLPEDRAARWAGLVEEARQVLRRGSPRHAGALDAALASVTPRPAAPGPVMSSLSSSDAFGGVVLSEPPDAVELACALAHEFRHMKLNAVLDLVDMYDDHDDGALYYAPWRDVPRPLGGLFQGVYAFLGVVDHWKRLLDTAEGPELWRAQFEFAYWRTQVRDTYRVLRDSPRWTPEGERFVELMGVGGPSGKERMPADIEASAEEAVADHRLRWRLHHLRPATDEVTGLAAARLRGARRPTHPGVSTLSPDQAAGALAEGMARIRSAAIDPAGPRTGLPGPAGTDAHAADRARLSGDAGLARDLCVNELTAGATLPGPWVGLALALRVAGKRPGGETYRAARALWHRPELVRAVYTLLRSRTDTAPDPVALAAWIGGPRTAGPPPVHRP